MNIFGSVFRIDERRLLITHVETLAGSRGWSSGWIELGILFVQGNVTLFCEQIPQRLGLQFHYAAVGEVSEVEISRVAG